MRKPCTIARSDCTSSCIRRVSVINATSCRLPRVSRAVARLATLPLSPTSVPSSDPRVSIGGTCTVTGGKPYGNAAASSVVAAGANGESVGAGDTKSAGLLGVSVEVGEYGASDATRCIAAFRGDNRRPRAGLLPDTVRFGCVEGDTDESIVERNHGPSADLAVRDSSCSARMAPSIASSRARNA